VRAAIDAQAALRDAEIAARIGISTGEVHVLSSPGEPLHVSGPPASAASQLEGRAPTGGVLLGNETYTLVRDALRAEEKDGAWLAVEVVPGAPAYARRLDAPLIGRERELERVEAAYADVRDNGHCRVVTVVGEAGIGKTRLMRELLQPLRGEARILVGRCVSYGEGATYLPVAEAVRQAAATSDAIAGLLEGEGDAEQVARRIAELTGLAEGPAAPGEAFWAVRRFVETVAREQPLVLVLDDIHWAEPTLLDLIEYLGEWADARVLVLCAARRELIESRPAWGGPGSTGFLVELEALDDAQTRKLLHGLSDEPLAPEAQQHIVEKSGGNPLFAEQLVALAQEAPDLVGETPANVEALLASRLDRLDPRERSVLRRAAVLGRRFTKRELADLTPRSELERTARDLAALAERALIHPREHVFAFHHVLVRDVAYRSIPKSERADLHELAARGLDRRDAAEEIVGYHFEQAHRYVTELGLGAGRAHELALAGGDNLGRAGIRAWQRADVPAAANLLRRAVELTPGAHHLACELGLALNVLGDRPQAMQIFTGVVGQAHDHQALRANVEHGVLQSLAEPEHAGDLLDAATRAIPVLEAAGDDRALGRAWYGIAHIRGGFYCEYAAMEEAAERIASCYRRAGWPLATAVEMLGLALEFGPRPVAEAIERLTELAAEDASRWMNANALVWLGRLEAMRANVDVARGHVQLARAAFDELALLDAARDTCPRAFAAIAVAAGDLESAAESLGEACAYVKERHLVPVLATRAAEFAAVLYLARRYDEAADWTRIARDSAGDDDLDAALTRRPVEAMLHARNGRSEEAERLARATVELAAKTDSPNRRADSLLALAEVLELAGAGEEVHEHVDAALALYRQKGNTAALARVRAQHEEPAAGLFVPGIQPT
jgi:tetratricopeptide (TPR) repeat protein